MKGPYQHSAPAYADILLPVAIPNTYTYFIPDELKGKIIKGCRVEVQFGKRKLYAGLVYHIHNNPPAYDIKPIREVLDEEAIVTETQLTFWKWLADYYMCTMGEVLNAALPNAFKLTSETTVVLDAAFHKQDLMLLASVHNQLILDKAQLVISALKNRNELTIDEIQGLLERKNVYHIINFLLEKKIIILKEELKEQFKPRIIDYVRLHEKYSDDKMRKALFDSLEKAPKQLELVLSYFQLKRKDGDIRKKELLNSVKTSHAVLNALIKKDIFQLYEKIEGRLENFTGATNPLKPLSEVQQNTLDAIKEGLKEKQVFLLHGVTSSGKTHIYMQLMREYIAQGKQVLYLLPEIALTTQIITRLQSVFGNKIGIYHSKFSNNERIEIWKKALRGEYDILLGARSAMFLPFINLGLVIVDEEHDYSYKQFDPAPRYNARDSAIYLAQLHKAKTLLGTATPSVESYFNAKRGKYAFAELNERFGGVQMPEIGISSLKKETAKEKKADTLFTKTLLEEIENALKRREQVILFQNRRGYVPVLECRDCGWTPMCENCDITLTYYKYRNELKCHYCGYKIAHPKACIACGSIDLKIKGFGTEKIEEELEIYFPDAKIARMDLDTTRTKFGHSKIINAFEDKEIDILVGTQMVTKGLDFGNVSLVGILSAEHILYRPDFRATERAFHLMAQVSGRAGRKNKQGKVIIQTYDKNNPVIQHVITNDYKGFYESEVRQRKAFHYPPFYRLIKVTLKHKNAHDLNIISDNLAKILKSHYKNDVLGPEFPPVSRIRNRYLKNIFIKIDSFHTRLTITKQNILQIITFFKTERQNRSAIIQLDADPVD